MADQYSSMDFNYRISEGVHLNNGFSFKISNGVSKGEKPLFIATKNETCFGHFTSASSYCSRIHNIQKDLYIATEIKLSHECFKRLMCALNFMKKLENYVDRELSRLTRIYSYDFCEAKGLNLDHYRKLCEEAKPHLFHWQHIEHKLCQLQLPIRLIAALRTQINKFKIHFFCLRRKILCCLHNIAVTGVKVLANASFIQLSSTANLQNFLQGIEAFNHMISAEVKCSLQCRNLYSFKSKNICTVLNSPLPTFDLVGILSTICVERSKLLAKLTHENFVQEAKAVELLDSLSTARFSWDSQGHVSTQDLLECSVNVRYGRLQTVIKKYGHKEEEFIKQMMGTASVCAFLHHESEVNRHSTEYCEKHNEFYGCDCNPVQLGCLACQMKQSSIKALMEGYEYSEVQKTLSSKENTVSQYDLRSLFMETKPSKAIGQLFVIYSNDLWKRFCAEFYRALESLNWLYSTDVIGPVSGWSTVCTIGVTQHFDNLAATGPFPDIGIQSVRHVSCYMYLRSVLCTIDNLYCLMIAVGQQDKCKLMETVVPGTSTTKTTALMIQACSVFQHFFTTSNCWNDFMVIHSNPHAPVFIQDVFDSFGSFLDFGIFWFTTKVRQFLANWSLEPFFLIAYHEIGVVVKSINKTLQLMEKIHCQMISNLYHTSLKCQWDEMERKAGYLQIIEVESLQHFKNNFVKLASEFWKEMMPKGRPWKQSRNSGSYPSEPSSYVEYGIIQLLQPVIKSVTQLPQHNTVIVQTVEMMMDTWSNHILREQMKFSVIGAKQLQIDFNYVKLWLISNASTLNATVQSDVDKLSVFHQLNEAVQLLMMQPKNKRKRNIGGNDNNVNMDSNLSTISGSSVLSGPSSYDGDLDVLNSQIIPNKDQWLNLRLRKGRSQIPLLLPDCLKPSETT